MYPPLPDTDEDPWAVSGRIAGHPSRARWEMDNSTGPIDPVTEQFIAPEPPDIERVPRQRKQRNPVLVGVLVVVILIPVLFGAGVLAHKMMTGNWGLPGVKDQLQLPTMSAEAAPSATSEPSASPQAPPPQAAPTGPIAQDIPTWIVVRRGQTMLVNSSIDGAYTPTGGVVDPPGDKPYWLSASSKVGDSMTIPAVIIGHTMNGNADMPFTILSEVRAGDLIDITVPTGVITFQVDTSQTPDKGMMGFDPESDTVKLVTCTSVGDKNVEISAHRVASHT